MSDKKKLTAFIHERLDLFYSRIKETGTTDELESQYISGVMAACRLLDVLSKRELEEIVNSSHLESFGMSADERRIANALEEGGEHWSFFETPITHRKK